jgi:hypothetical protein
LGSPKLFKQELHCPFQKRIIENLNEIWRSFDLSGKRRCRSQLRITSRLPCGAWCTLTFEEGAERVSHVPGSWGGAVTFSSQGSDSTRSENPPDIVSSKSKISVVEILVTSTPLFIECFSVTFHYNQGRVIHAPSIEEPTEVQRGRTGYPGSLTAGVQTWVILETLFFLLA